MNGRRRVPPLHRSRWPGSLNSTPWGRVVDAYDTIIDHVNAHPTARVLLAGGDPNAVVRMHQAAAYYFPQAGGHARGGVWLFPNGARARICLFRDEFDLEALQGQAYSMIVSLVDVEMLKLLEVAIAPGGQFVPFLGMR